MREMAYEVSIKTQGVQTVEFENYDKLLKEATLLADEMQRVQVTEENQKHYKTLLAEVRKRIKALDKETVSVKNKLLEPYQSIDEQRKELKEVLQSAITSIDSQIKEYTYAEQELRKEKIKELFIKYQVSYNAPKWLSFDKFIAKNRSLVTNKSTSQKTITQAIVMYFELFKQDYSDLKEVVSNKDERSAILMSYSKNGFNMDEAIKDYQEMMAERKRLEKEQERVKKTKVPEIIILTGNEVKPLDKPKEVEYSIIKVKTSDLAKLKDLAIEWEEM